MQPKTIGNYGGPYADATPADNPETDLAADEGNRALEDIAQVTQTISRAWVSFPTTAAAAPTTVTPTHNSLWGSGAGQAPTIDKSATGRYGITYAASFIDGLSISESVAFLRPFAQGWPSTGDVLDDIQVTPLSLASNVLTLKVESPPGTLADVGNNSGDVINVEVLLR